MGKTELNSLYSVLSLLNYIPKAPLVKPGHGYSVQLGKAEERTRDVLEGLPRIGGLYRSVVEVQDLVNWLYRFRAAVGIFNGRDSGAISFDISRGAFKRSFSFVCLMYLTAEMCYPGRIPYNWHELAGRLSFLPRLSYEERSSLAAAFSSISQPKSGQVFGRFPNRPCARPALSIKIGPTVLAGRTSNMELDTWHASTTFKGASSRGHPFRIPPASVEPTCYTPIHNPQSCGHHEIYTGYLEVGSIHQELLIFFACHTGQAV